MLRFPILGRYADIRELNDVSSKQILNRGRSPSRRGGNSGMRRKMRCSSSSRHASYPTTQARSGHSTKRSGGGDPESVLQNTTPDLEKDLPDSASVRKRMGQECPLRICCTSTTWCVKVEFWKLLNNMIQDEVYSVLKSDVCIMEYDPHEDVNEALSDLEKKLCQHFSRIEIKGKRGRKVPVLLTPVMEQGLDLLVGTRQEWEVPRENIYLFARPSALTCYRGSDCLRHFAKVRGAKSPESLTSTKLRKQTGTLSQVLNPSNTELDQLADFLGYDIRVHRQFYRLPEGSKVLMALDQGRLAEFKGKTLDDINIDPKGKVKKVKSDLNRKHSKALGF
ncbi:unnamed protein product [Leuciscus chuanchicus]